MTAHTGGADTGAGGSSVSGTLTSAQFSGFSDFALGATNDLSTSNSFNAINPLPVELVRFEASREARGVAVTWATASEKNSASFEVQRSLDGRAFAPVAMAAAQGRSSQLTAYAALDRAAPAARLYYRLRQVDRDGTLAYSPVVTVAGSGPAAKVLYTPIRHVGVSVS